MPHKLWYPFVKYIVMSLVTFPMDRLLMRAIRHHMKSFTQTHLCQPSVYSICLQHEPSYQSLLHNLSFSPPFLFIVLNFCCKKHHFTSNSIIVCIYLYSIDFTVAFINTKSNLSVISN